MIKFLLILFMCVFSLKIYAQKSKKNKNYRSRTNIKQHECFDYLKTNPTFVPPTLSEEDSIFFKNHEDSLIYYINALQGDSIMPRIKYHDSVFIVLLKRTLLHKNSFYYDFENLSQYIYIIQNQEKNFKVFTWQYTLNTFSVLQQGVMQIRYAIDSFKLVPLLDRSAQLNRIYDTILNANAWIGALYYELIENKDLNKKNVYTLLGLDENTILSTKKWIDFLSFNEQCEPQFGAPYFNFRILNQKQKLENFNKKNISYHRYNIEYSKETSANLKYDLDMNIIIFDHLRASDENNKEKKYAYFIDGDYEGFKWQNGKWNYIPKVFDFSLQDGQAPIEKPVNFEKEKNMFK